MIRVGQCEGCECWYRARILEAACVAKPNLAARERLSEVFGAVPGLLPAPEVAYFCPDCMGALRARAGDEESLIWKPGDPTPEPAASRTRARAGVGAGEDVD